MRKLEGKSVLITGASSGIGAAVARECARLGANVALLSRRVDRLDALAKEIMGTGVKALPIACDVTRDGSIEAAAALARKEFDGIDIVVANAGYGVAGPIARLSLQDFRNQMETNFFGLIRTIYATIDDLKRSRGRLVVLGSVSGWLSLPETGPYSSSKYAVRGLTEAITPELLTHGVSVTLISPGFVESEIRSVDNHGVLKPERKDPIPTWLRMSADDAARRIIRATLSRKRECIITLHGWLAVFLNRHFPWLVRGLVSTLAVKGRAEPK
jgi:uncharacterized protein